MICRMDVRLPECHSFTLRLQSVDLHKKANRLRRRYAQDLS
jgi:hypothetical protein